MKQKLLLLLFFFLVTVSYAQQIPNGNFNNWINSTTAQGWNSSIEVGTYPFIYTIQMAERSNSSYEGSYCAKLETKSAFDYTIPGLIQLGDLNFTGEDLSISGGLPFAERPLGLSVFVKYFPADNDTAFVISYMTKYNSETLNTDTISLTFYPIFGTISEYQEVLIPYIYLSQETCDTINILFVSSNPLNSKVGSILYVDNLTLSYEFSPFSTLALQATDITDTSFIANWFPSPMSDNYRLDVATDESFNNIIPEYNDLSVNGSSFLISTNTSKSNQYFYRIRVDYDTVVSPNSNIVEVIQNFSAICTEATEILNNGFTANWTTQDNPLNHNLYISTDTNFTNIVSGFDGLNVGLNESFIVNGLNTNEKYFYKIQSIYELGNNPFSNIISVSTTNVLIDEIQQINYIIQNKSLKFTDLPNSKINIFDLNGNILYSSNVFGEKTIQIENSGIYLIEIKSVNKTYKFKIYIQ